MAAGSRSNELLVDVIIAAWNRADTIERAMVSALGEAEVSQVIVVDDGSTDHTYEVAKAVASREPNRVTVCRLDLNSGPSTARNAGLAVSRASWIAVLDADDYILPGRFQDLLRYADDADLVADNLLQIEDGGVIGEKIATGAIGLEIDHGTISLEQFVLGNVSSQGRLRKEFGFLKPMIRRSFLDRHSLRYDEQLRLGEDYALYARALATGGRFKVIPTQKYVSVARSDSLSGKHSKCDLENLRDSDLELARLPSISNTERSAIWRHFQSVDSRVQWLAVIEAVKSRDPKSFFGALFRSWTVFRYVVFRLTEQIFFRGRRLIGF